MIAGLNKRSALALTLLATAAYPATAQEKIMPSSVPRVSDS